MTFDPRTVPVGGTVRGLFSKRVYRVIADDAVQYDPDTEVKAMHVSADTRDPGRHRAPGEPDQTTFRRRDPEHRKPGDAVTDPAMWAVAGPMVVPDGTPYHLEDPATGDVLGRGTIVNGRTVPELPYAGPWSVDGHGNVRVPIHVARALWADLVKVVNVEFSDVAWDDAGPDNWPAARDLVVGMRKVNLP